VSDKPQISLGCPFAYPKYTNFAPCDGEDEKLPFHFYLFLFIRPHSDLFFVLACTFGSSTPFLGMNGCLIFAIYLTS
jgi:hypothetical protein